MALYKLDVFTFNDLTKRVLVDVGVTSLTVQRIYNACRLYESEPAALDNLSICRASGKDPLGGVKAVGITMTMLDGWQLEFQTLPAEVSDGNYLGLDAGGAEQNPIFGDVVTRSLDTSASLVVTGGSAVTQQDKDDIENQIFARIVEGGYTFEQIIRLTGALAAGDIAQATDGSYTITGLDGVTARILGELAANNGRDITSINAS